MLVCLILNLFTPSSKGALHTKPFLKDDDIFLISTFNYSKIKDGQKPKLDARIDSLVGRLFLSKQY